jgi:hypothetical protein
MKLVIVVLVLLCAPSSVLGTSFDLWTGTTIVVSLSEAELVIGADSKETGGGRAAGQIRLGCKIIRTANMVFAVAGMSEYTGTAFSAADIFLQETKGKGLELGIQEFDKSIKPRLVQAIAHIANNYPHELQQQIHSGVTLTAIIGGMREAVPILFVREFSIEMVNGAIKLRTKPIQHIGVRQSRLFMFGERDAIENFLDINPTVEKEEAVKKIRKLIEVEIATGSPKVGAPIDIARITTPGVEWVQRKAQCPEEGK